ncbi:sulfatase [bacterium]|nr:sulfatase [bacterium]
MALLRSKYTFCFFVGALVFLAACNQSFPSENTRIKPAEPMNLVLVSLDTLRADRLGCYGYPLPTSPFLDELSRYCVQATDVLAQNPSTILSHRAIFTGLYVHQQTSGKAPANKTLAGKLAGKGYVTAAFTDGGLMHRQYGNDPGFNLYDDEGGGLSKILDKSLTWLDNHGDTPFFLFLHTYDIHYPYTPAEPFADMFLPKGKPPYHLGADHGQGYWNEQSLSRNEFIWISRRYDGGIRSTDGQMMRLWSELKSRELLENTVIVIVSDHGESLGERLFVGHRQLFDVQLQVPLIFYIPESSDSFILDGAVETIDILPTLLDILAVEEDNHLPGMSLVNAIASRTSRGFNRPRLSETWARAFRQDRDWKFILRETPSDDELYWVSQDPEEMRNVAGFYPDRTEDLRQALLDFTGLQSGTIRKVRDQRQIPIMLMQKDESGRENILMDQLRELGYLQ